MVPTFSRHIVAEYFGCRAELLDDVDAMSALLEEAALAADVRVLQTVTHRFTPQGVSVVVVIEESHLSIHTWPEAGYAAVDFYTCGNGDPERAHAVLARGLGAERAEVMTLHRGLDGPRAIKIAEHRVDGPPGLPHGAPDGGRQGT